MVNWSALLLFLCCVRMALENLLKYGIRVSVSGWITFLVGDPTQPHLYPVFYLLAVANIPLLTALGLEILQSRGSMDWPAACILHCINIVILLSLPVILINWSSLQFGLVSAVCACSLYCVLCLKLISYIQVNKWCRDLAFHRHQVRKHVQASTDGRLLVREKTFLSVGQLQREGEDQQEMAEEEDKLVHYPDNLTPRDLYYFCSAPTLCYELNFPRTVRIRKSFLLWRLFEVILGTYLIMACTQQWIIPTVVNSLVPFSRTDLPLATERLIRLSLPNHIVWLVGGYLLFHSGLNIVGELLQFADRNFYRDWWNSPNFAKFWQNWNLLVHQWAVRHVYKPLLVAGWSRLSAICIVFLVSSFLHEYFVSVPLRMFKVWVFLGFMCNFPLVILSTFLESTLGPRAGNMSMWLFLIMGQPLLVMTYYHDYVIEHYGPSLIAYYGHLNSTSL